MNKIIFFSTPAFGHVYSVVPVIKALVAANYRVEWYCTKKYKELVLKSGAEFCEYPGNFDEKYNLSDLTQDFYTLFCSLLELNNKYFVLFENKVDDACLILYDSMCSFAKNIAKKKGVKSICLCTTMAYNINVFLFSNMFISSLPLFLKHGFDFLKRILSENKFRKSHGIAKVNVIDLFLNKGDITIVFTPMELQPFVNTFPKSFIFVGTTIKDRKQLETATYEDYDIYISLGTIAAENKQLLEEIISDEFINSKKVIVSVGGLDIKSNNKNITIVSNTNQLSLLQNCKLFINHGGLNSVYESINAGVLQVCIPQQQEQKLTAKVIERKGLGIHTKEFETNIIKQMFNNADKYKEKLEQYSGIIKKYDGTTAAVNAIKKHLGKSI